MILPDTDQSGALIVAERIRQAVEDLGLKHEASYAARVVTISVGAATATSANLDAAEMLKVADTALYSSKREGRNCVTNSDVVHDFMFV